MDVFLTYIFPYLISSFAALISGFIAYKTAVKQAKLESIKQKDQFVLENNLHIKKLHYENTFQIYKSLSDSFLNMIADVSFLFPYGIDHVPTDKEIRKRVYEERYKNARKSFDNASHILFSNAPFVDKDIYDKFFEIRQLCEKQVSLFPFLIINDNWIINELTQEKHECDERTNKISNLRQELTDYLRDKIKIEEAQKIVN